VAHKWPIEPGPPQLKVEIEAKRAHQLLTFAGNHPALVRHCPMLDQRRSHLCGLAVQVADLLGLVAIQLGHEARQLIERRLPRRQPR
jgi:hypothetical protein